MMLKRWLPILVFLIICGFLWRGLFLQPKLIPSAKIGQHVPDDLFSKWHGQVYLIHFWASWCDSCEQEQMLIADWVSNHKIPLVGINYKDHSEQAKPFIQLWGKSYVDMIEDPQGKIGMDFGVIATPETFIVDKRGVIRYRHQGPLTREQFVKEIEPKLQELMK